MNSPFALVLCALWLSGCALRPPSPEAFVFGVMGDTPYNDREEKHFVAMIERMNAEPLAFVVHVGDIKSGSAACSDALFEKRKAQFDASAHPLVYTPGDNEWTDCRTGGKNARDPLERLAKLRELFFSEPLSLGRSRIATEMQTERSPGCTAYPENRSWSRSAVRFVTLNVPGSDNNVGFDRASDEEARCRDEANRIWLERAVRESEDAGTRALVVAIQANPWRTTKGVYRGLLAQLQQAAQRLRKPVLFVHGDTHTYRADYPFVDAVGQPVANLTRLETFGSPAVGWVRVTVNPADPEVFRFEPKLQALVP
jgi:hypothetical protein